MTAAAKLNLIAVAASPRKDGTSDVLLAEALAGARSAGAAAEYIALRDRAIAACTECGRCATTGECPIKDDFQPLAEKLLAADRVIIATPIFFMTVPAQLKLFIDRCQCLWSRKYLLGRGADSPGRDRRAAVIAVGGSKSTNMFDSIRLTMKYFLDVFDLHYVANLFVNQLDTPDAARNHPAALESAARLGRNLITNQSPPPQKPKDTILT